MVKYYDDIVVLNESIGDLDLIWLVIEEVLCIIDWLEDFGFEFVLECLWIIYGYIFYNIVRMYYGVDKVLFIFKVFKFLWNE